jgi:uncharacterized protein (DUF697 family)/tellurite resistance protein
MTPEQNRAVLTIALLAASCDGHHDERERTRLRDLAARLSSGGGAPLPDVLIDPPDVDRLAAELAGDPRLAQIAYETAVNVADADGAHSDAEGAFLARLARALRLPEAPAREYVARADAIASAAAPEAAGAGDARVSGVVQPQAAELDKRILDASITNAALELLPESIASMAILPLQVRLVYRIGQAYGYELGAAHIKEFVATLGVGLTGQYLEQFGRKLLGGVLGSVLGGVGRTVGRQAASSGMAFATTWAIGQVAREYYAAGRTLDANALKSAFGGLVERGRGMVAQYAPAIEERARSIDLRALPDLVRRV